MRHSGSNTQRRGATAWAATAALGAATAAALLAGNAEAQPSPVLQPVPERISDGAIHADHLSYERMQTRIKALNDSGGHRVASYSLAKAQCWLDVSFHEYSRNDRSAFPQASLSESARIVDYLARSQDPLAADNPAHQTPLVNQASRLRPDLWQLAADLKTHEGYRCAGQHIACAEVELVHAGNEYKQQGWRHAKPYVQIAEDRLADASAAAKACAVPPSAPGLVAAPAPLAVAALEPPPPPPAVTAAPAPLQRQLDVLFNFDKRAITDVLAASKQNLDQLVEQLNSLQGSGAWKVDSIVLTGHADISNGTGNPAYNVKLAQDRAHTVKQFLVAQGLDAQLVTVNAKADTEQVVQCDRKALSRTALKQCLLPNRRVQLELRGWVTNGP